MKTTSVIYAQSIVYYLKHVAEVVPEKVHSLEQTHLKSNQSRIAIEDYANLLNEGAAATNDSLFGFTLGQHIQTTDYGVLGYLIESCQNLQQALTCLLDFESLVAELGRARFETFEHSARVIWQPFQVNEKQVILRNMTAWVATVRKLLFGALAPQEVSLSCNLNTAELKRLEDWYQCPVSANAPVNTITFPMSFLTLPFRSSNQALHKTLTIESKKLLIQFSSNTDISKQIEFLLAAKPDLLNCDQKRIAEALNISVRTMQRKLKQQEVNFITLLNNERKKRAKILIKQHSLAQITLMLGYAEQATLTKAFKHWYGITPSQYKAKLKNITNNNAL